MCTYLLDIAHLCFGIHVLIVDEVVQCMNEMPHFPQSKDMFQIRRSLKDEQRRLHVCQKERTGWSNCWQILLIGKLTHETKKR